MHKLFSHAIVLGGSLAGLLAARAASDFFQNVTLVERDAVPTDYEPRKGVPQGKHIHVLLAKGSQLLDNFFPNLMNELVAQGATKINTTQETCWYHYGGWKLRHRGSIYAYLMSRPFLEQNIRARVLKIPNVQVRAETDILGLVADNAGRVTGANIQTRGGDAEILNADFVIDATGRSGQAVKWLDALGYPKPIEEAVEVDVAYASRIYARKPNDLPDAKLFVIYPQAPRETRLGVLSPLEGDRWIVTLGGWIGDHPPRDEAGFMDYIRNLPAPDLFPIVQKLEPLSEISVHRFPSNLRRHYEQLARVPEGFVALGDAVCSFNPIYGQGMTSSVIQADALANVLRAHTTRNSLDGLSRKFYRATSGQLKTIWQLATGEDFRYPQVQGTRPPETKVLNAYVARIHRAVLRDAFVYDRFGEVLNLLRPPTILFYPQTVARVLANS